MKRFYENYRWYIVGALTLFTLYFSLAVYKDVHSLKDVKSILSEGIEVVDLGYSVKDVKYIPSMEYFETCEFAFVPDDSERFITVDESASFSDTTTTFNEAWVTKDANEALFDLADKYYQVYYGSTRVSPIYPLALANVETGNRADHNITWSSLFPSKVLPISMLYEADVTTVVNSSKDVYKALTTEWSTRDRGALQMSPTYGTGRGYFESLMSGTEKSKLKEAGFNLSDSWISKSSDELGDRFYAPDVCLRLSSANTDAIENILKNKYTPTSDLQLIVMLAMYHHRSGVWSNSNHDKKCGEWFSSEKAFTYSKELSSPEFVSTVKEHIQKNPKVYTLSQEEALSLYKECFGKNPTEYTKSTLVSSYPIKVIYSYIKLCSLYSI